MLNFPRFGHFKTPLRNLFIFLTYFKHSLGTKICSSKTRFSFLHFLILALTSVIFSQVICFFYQEWCLGSNVLVLGKFICITALQFRGNFSKPSQKIYMYIPESTYYIHFCGFNVIAIALIFLYIFTSQVVEIFSFRFAQYFIPRIHRKQLRVKHPNQSLIIIRSLTVFCYRQTIYTQFTWMRSFTHVKCSYLVLSIFCQKISNQILSDFWVNINIILKVNVTLKKYSQQLLSCSHQPL